jgi:hypothetical protein
VANAVFGEFVTAVRTPVVLGEDAPVGLVTIADGLELSYDATLGRVRIAVGAVALTAVSAVVDRSVDGVRWTTVRGGEVAVVGGGDLLVYDYEFPTGVALTYRVRTYDA